MADASPVLAAAVAERDHVIALITAHEKACQVPYCPDGLSLGAHLARTQAQVDLLTPPETEAMFDG